MAKDPIKKANNGTYYFRANLGYDAVTGKQIQKYRSGFSTKKEARAEYSKLILAAEEGLAMEKKQPSFKQFIEEIYLPWYKTQVKESTYKNRLNTIEKHFKFFYRKKVNEIEPIHVQTWQLKLAKDYSPNYVRIIQGMLSLAFDRAIILGLAKKNPARMVGNIKSKKVKVDFWTLEEFQKVISLLYKGDYYEHYLFICFWLLFTTGLRIGEAAALQWEDIDFESGIISVTKTLYYKSMNEYKFVDPKTSASIRTVVIDEDTIRELKDWMEVQKKVLKDCNFVLSYSGIPTSKHTLPRALEKLAGLAGVHRIKIHALRHSHVALLISMGVNPLIVKDRLGHEKIQTTLGTYGHLYPNSNFEVAKMLDGIINFTPATESIADYTHNQFTASYHRQI
ncbi:site-specific integrase [[Clostridium] scindens]|uniref:Site-specific integrase n=1 Tax=Clostridium scindens (strain JCM 10418 / VPI 12708) TaxID=29347 RepID=A0A844F833_CLOSV|nr:site-specific integrase [[Clostridium] scindens]MSS40210.1 site-specific integrase [[Clostridium] scindens]WPB23591.1 Tyrosine recombinase XerC [[Clostridium] scindens]